MKINLGKRLKELRESKDLTQTELARLVGLSQQTIGHYEVERVSPDLETMEKFTEIFDCTLDYLVGISNVKKIAEATLLVPLLGTIRAGIPLFSEENFEGNVEVPPGIDADFALTVKGDSMSWVGINDGDTAILLKTARPYHGMIVAAGIENDIYETTLKFFVEENGRPLLRAANPLYEDIPVAENHRIIGHVVSVLKEAPSLQDYRNILRPKSLEDEQWLNTIEYCAGLKLDGKDVKDIIEKFAILARGK